MSAWMGITNLLPSFFCIILQLLLDICMAHDLMPNLGHNAPYCVCVVHSCYVNDSMHACDSIFGSQVRFRLWVVLFHKSVCIIFRLLNMHVYTWHCECDHALFFFFFFFLPLHCLSFIWHCECDHSLFLFLFFFSSSFFRCTVYLSFIQLIHACFWFVSIGRLHRTKRRMNPMIQAVCMTLNHQMMVLFAWVNLSCLHLILV